MFPTLHQELKDLLPQAYFEGEEVPPYSHHESAPGIPTGQLIRTISSLAMGGNSCGYIDRQGIHYHIPEGETIQVDLSRKFVFVSQPGSPDGATVTPWQTFFFLMEPVRKALFIGEEHATLIEKTPETLTLCKVLDRLWSQERFLAHRMAMLESEEGRQEGLINLMCAFEEQTLGSASGMWRFWETFSPYLMTGRLHLAVTGFSRGDVD